MSEPVEYSCSMGPGGCDVESVKIDGHHFEFGGQGDGFCYAHQSFDCIDSFTREQSDRVHEAQDAYFTTLSASHN